MRRRAEHLGGVALDDVRVEFGSPLPTMIGAHAFTHGSDIHVAPSQGGHLGHEVWHAVQQKQGRAPADPGGAPVSTDLVLEREAEAMGPTVRSSSPLPPQAAPPRPASTAAPVVQRVVTGADGKAIGRRELIRMLTIKNAALKNSRSLQSALGELHDDGAPHTVADALKVAMRVKKMQALDEARSRRREGDRRRRRDAATPADHAFGQDVGDQGSDADDTGAGEAQPAAAAAAAQQGARSSARDRTPAAKPPVYHAAPKYGPGDARTGASSMSVTLGPGAYVERAIAGGSSPQPGELKSLDVLPHFGVYGWIAGHLLNQKMGGPGTARNLTPLTGTTNKKHSGSVEGKIKSALYKMHTFAAQDKVYWYGIKYDVMRSSKAMVQQVGADKGKPFPAFVPASIHCTATVERHPRARRDVQPDEADRSGEVMADIDLRIDNSI